VLKVKNPTVLIKQPQTMGQPKVLNIPQNPIGDKTFPIVPTVIVDNFFSEDEIDFIKSFIDNYPERNTAHSGTEPTKPSNFIERNILSFDESLEYEDVNELVHGRIKQKLHPSTVIGSWQILTQFFPYRAHSNAIYGEYKWDENHYAAWTLIIPLDTFDSRTIIFNEYSYKTKLVPEFIENRTPVNKIDDETYEKYLTLESPDSMKYFSIEDIVKWEKSKGIAISRYKFHADDNFLKYKLPYKQAIIAWTALPNYVDLERKSKDVTFLP
jgi:hypothetical protein